MPGRETSGGTSPDEGPLAVAVTAAAASILGNIALLVDRRGLVDQGEGLRRQQAHLLAVLGQWQEAHGRLCQTAERQRAELASAHSREAELEREVQRLRARVVELEAHAASSEGDEQDAAS